MAMTSIANIMYTARGGLMATQTALSVTSTNITNAKTIGYTAKSTDIATTVVGGQATGVMVVGIGNAVNTALMREVMGATSESAHDATLAAYAEGILNALGTTDSGSALETALSDLMSVLGEAVNAGGSAQSAADVTDALETWAATLRDTSQAVQASRTTADTEIAETVDDINALLSGLDDLNDEIARATATGDPTADLLDSQRVMLETLSGLVDITYFTTGTGELRVYSAGGTPLLTSSAQTLSYTPFGRMTADAAYDPSGGGTVQGIEVHGTDITAALSGGTLGALITARDTTLPAIQEGLDALAMGIADALNAAASKATPVPAPGTLTGTTAVAGADPFSGSGILSVAAVDADGTVVSSTDIDLSTIATHADLVAALDGAAGVSATLDANGHVVITADTAGTGVVLAGETTVGANGWGLAHALGINTVMSGTGASDLAVAETVGSQGLPVAIPASTTVGDTALVKGDTSGLQALWTALDDPIAFDATSTMTAAERSAIGQTAALIDDVADRASAAGDAASLSAQTYATLSNSFTNAHGVNVDEESAKLLALEQSYQSVSQIISTAQDMFDSLVAMMN
ncbi:flagellar hook-associated protein FlgK [Roseospira visakhapatnamensis]|uniref:Flagellar hook-associated protein 1 n=1 Tax=Roseospira visakhapatnamensis TaxID=390880 RepID=A0A7W6W961_9PROT|nr:flagellar hook-associated protein FlgK [Roseospira visakhapatnamensis]MBB4265503.1 flagellar hook-associated protein 1 FlgK [Roseospira visakhapatnamensis]